jgi:restriction system protein
MQTLPTREMLMLPVLNALSALGGSGSIDEIHDRVVADLKIPDHLVNLSHVAGQTDGRTRLDYELGWVRTMLKGNGYVENSRRGIWALKKHDFSGIGTGLPTSGDGIATDLQEDWQTHLLRVLTQKLSPAAFERLIQRMLREKGFSQVEVTGRTGDGGIDGKGIAKINGILSFHVVFQCKRYQGGVSSSHIRDFRGAMIGRTDKGLFITTGYFTRDAIKEANRDGAPAIDLIDGEKLIEKLKELSLGVDIELIERVRVNESWFDTL